MSNYILFGAGKNIRNYIYIIRAMGDEVSLILDNSVEKQRIKIEGIDIQSPLNFDDHNERIMITCLAFDEVRVELYKLGLKEREMQIADYLKSKGALNEEEYNTIDSCKKTCVVLDLYSRERWGGAEKWNFSIFSKLKSVAAPLDMLLLKSEYVYLDKRDDSIRTIPKENSIPAIIDNLKQWEQIVFFNSFHSDIFFALLLMKICQRKRVRIITVVHNDYGDLYKQCMLYEPFIDHYLCVSKMIAHTMINMYGIDKNKITCISQPIEIPWITSDQKPRKEKIQIGIASRLAKAQKRCELIPQLIELLEKKVKNYNLEIAGDGELYQFIKEYVDKNKLNNKVILRGKLSDAEMCLFWKKTDVYVNFSDFEGTSLAMLEAMSYMCVPVVTCVSGVIDYIEDKKSGFVHNKGDLKGITDSINYLMNNRLKMEQIGEEARKSVLKKCNEQNICETIMKLVR